MNSTSAEVEAKATAAKHVANMLQRPDQLEKVEQFKKRVSRKKASVDAMLKSAVQSQLDGVRTGLGQLQTSLGEIAGIRKNLEGAADLYKQVAPLEKTLRAIRDENSKHCQYAAAVENLKHIFNVPESVQRTEVLISEDKFLHAHKCLTDLENSRDDLLFELHKLPQQSPTDRNLLKTYFSSVEKLSDSLGKKIVLVLDRCLNTVRKEPTVVVSVLRIIEREEKRDEYFAQRQRQTGFLPPGRPKKWQERCFKVLRKGVETRIEANQMEDRTVDKMWLVRHLEVTRQIMVQDLTVVKTLCEPCFPPSYNIVQLYVTMYHDALSQHLHDMVDEQLQGNEVVSLLTWARDYKGYEMMGSKNLDIDLDRLPPLLDAAYIGQLMEQYLNTMQDNIKEWIPNTLSAEIIDWESSNPPEEDQNGHYHTPVPVILFQMVEQNLQVASQINQELTLKVLGLCADEMIHFASCYKEKLKIFRSKHAEDRSILNYFVHYVIAIVNNCTAMTEFSQKLKSRYLKEEGKVADAVSKKFNELHDCFAEIAIEGCSSLSEEVFIDLNSYLQDLVTKKWMTGTHTVDTICITVDDYCSDFCHIRPKFLTSLLWELQNRLVTEYIKAMMQRKMQFRNAQERKEGADKICRENEQLRQLFQTLSVKHKVAMPRKSAGDAFAALPSINELLKLQDPSLLGLEISGIAKKFPDVKIDHLVQLILLRGDLGRGEARQLVCETYEEKRHVTPKDQTVFSRISVG